MAHVYATQRIPGDCFSLIADAGHTLAIHTDDNIMSPAEIIENAGHPSVLVCTLANEIGAELFDALPSIRMVANYAVGYNNIAVEAATERGIVVTNTPGALTEATADLTWSLLLASARHLVKGDWMCRHGEFRGWLPTMLLGREVHGATIGIAGAGRIGSAVARRAKGFGMRIIYFSRSRKLDLESETGATQVTLVELFEQSDFASIHLPYSKQTHHLINGPILAVCKPGMTLINTGRGAVIDEKALIEGLSKGRPAFAALDVYEHEPDIPEELKQMPNVLLAPHIGSATESTRARMGEVCAANVLAFLSGNRPPNPVNPAVFGG
ncbi:MAG: D-glycerate dehydrogenase [Candidatus Brocadiia bacterium]